MAIEDELKSLVLSTFGNMRTFSDAAGIPYTTLSSIFKRGVDNASIANIIKICTALSISADALADGRIAARNDEPLPEDEAELLRSYRSVNDEGKHHILETARLVAGNPAMKKETSAKLAM